MKPSAIVGAPLVLLGGVVMLGWWLHVPLLVRVLPGLPAMVFNTALAFALAGAALLLMSRDARLAATAGGLIAILATLVLVEHLFQARLGIDMASWHAWLLGASQKPGRMSAGTGCAFLMSGMALTLAPRVPLRSARLAANTLALGVGIIGLMAFAGHLVNASLLFPNYLFTDVAAHTAFGLLLLAIGMALAWRQFATEDALLLHKEHDRVTFAGATILVAIAFATGVAIFGILQGRFQSLALENVLESLTTRTQTFEDMISLREVNARIAATRPAVLRNLRVIQQGRDDGSNIANVRAVVDGLVTQGFSGVAYYGIDTTLVASGGAFAKSPSIAVDLATPEHAELMWDDGFVMRHRIAMHDAQGPVGVVLAEQRLPVLTRVAQDIAQRGETWDMGLCALGEQRLHCFPQRLNPRAFTTPLVNVVDEPLPMTRALRGEAGAVVTRDYRSQHVVAAYGPVGNFGLGMVVKVDAAEVFQPIREMMFLAIGVLSLFALGGTLLLRQHVRPLVSKLIDAKHALQEKNVELAKANQAKDSFLASMSHELRTPLNAIIGFTGTLLLRLPGPLTADQEKQLSIVKTSARHLLALINDLLDVAKIEAGKFEPTLEPVDCKLLVDEVAATLRQQAEGKGLQFSIDTPGEAVLLNTDRRALSQIVINLTGNAIKFTERGGVQLRLRQGRNGTNRLTEIVVDDSGIGIPMEDQHKLFNAFSRVDSARARNAEGTGLGLHLSQKLAEALGGKIVLLSEVGRGSTFTLILPDQ